MPTSLPFSRTTTAPTFFSSINLRALKIVSSGVTLITPVVSDRLASKSSLAVLVGLSIVFLPVGDRLVPSLPAPPRPKKGNCPPIHLGVTFPQILPAISDLVKHLSKKTQ